jgi:hypothetical protein
VQPKKEKMDWDKIELPKQREKYPKSGELGLLDYWKLYVSAKLIRKSIMSVIQTAILTYLNRNWQLHEERLNAEAKQLNITPEDLFQKIVNKEIELK